IEADTPAQVIGLKPGDKVVEVENQPTPTVDSVSSAIRGSNGKPISLTVLRNGKVVTLGPVRTKKIGDHYALGFQYGWNTIQYGPIGAFRHSLDDNWRATKATITFLPRIVTSSGRKEVSGPIGISDVSQRVVSISFTWYLQVLGLISL